ncbi:MAG TPA: serine protein kinase RIO [Methanosarcina thermophila]|jgi:RIO kinase 1|uniref:non-specific serine/threonine protein kinase n=1 Tax=Methanosarcina thermophila (strain ATCC 43570 / DSM 1825 / OCM 12 / VKM B-1830 / TM-1) TaxID=523844 RepID=A0A0E3KYT2_METTT|nr:serine protein kinase RIO [Methanosarcina thermophila]AKB12997.1 Serine/threonine protein kinase [Methanosarcina thermophila TM-1]HOA69844.1 serine protein kinase RIO [Methanosarcina thermophila]HOQ66704.1 serine protein kinase RIO [Methanosarcina thermophila]HPT81732.1 serine protein kinase RIO [Methanosarcina thermophila]HPZ21061.1 serine protein kinase RIO [Methanosarcina thermophila]
MGMDQEKKIKRIDRAKDKSRVREKDSERLKVEENVFDVPTLKILYTLSNKGIIKAMGGAISTGKEANVFYAEGPDKELAVKIYRIASSTFKAMDAYIMKDPRFTNIRNNKRDIIFAWTRKEFQNLKRAKNAGVRVPEPVIAEKNILIMEFMGEKERPYPLLKNTYLEDDEAKLIFDTVVEYMRLLYKKANLVHADLSEYNILIDPKDLTPIFIDMGQSVTLEHPNSREFLYRDVQNILRFFSRYGIKDKPEELLKKIQAE